MNKVTESIASYYSQKISEFGASSYGVDWNSKESQFLRFAQLCQVIKNHETSPSINDLGCGYGALVEYLHDNYHSFKYSGFDISSDMLKQAHSYNLCSSNVRFVLSSRPDQMAQYSIASGIFNVCLNHSHSDWLDYIKNTLDSMNAFSTLGFAFNCLTSYSDRDKMKDYLYYADPCLLFDWCKRRYSKNVSLIHDYGLYEFTLLVRKA